MKCKWNVSVSLLSVDDHANDDDELYSNSSDALMNEYVWSEMSV